MLLTVVFSPVFFLSASANESNWQDISDQKQTRPDTVNWSNLNINYKPPRITDDDQKEQEHGTFIALPDTAQDSQINLHDLKETKINLERNIADLEKGLSKVTKKTENFVSETLKTNLDRAKKELVRVNEQISQLGQGISDTVVNSVPQTNTALIPNEGLQLSLKYKFDSGGMVSIPPMSEEFKQAFGGDATPDSVLKDLYKTPIFPLDGLTMASPVGFNNTSLGSPLLGEGIGEMYGFNGPILSCGKVKKVCTLVIYTASGAPVGTVTADDLEWNPNKTYQLLLEAERRSRQYQESQETFEIDPKYLLESLKFGGGMTRIDPPDPELLKKLDLPIDPAKPSRADLEKQIKDLEKALGKIPEGGDSLAQAYRESIQSSLQNARQQLSQLPETTPQSTTSTKPIQNSTSASLGNVGFGLNNRVRLNLDTSFTGEDRLQTRLDSDRLSSFSPSAVMSPQLGSTRGDLYQIADMLKNRINCKSSGFSESCFDDFRGCDTVSLIEPVYDRHVLKKKKDEPEEVIVPDDPLFHYEKGKKKKLLGIFGSSTENKIVIGANMRMGGGLMGAGAGNDNDDLNIKDQWGIKAVGYLPESDPTSAWSLVDENKRNVLVAVIDSGIDKSHPDAPQYFWVNENEKPGNGIDDDQNGYVDDVEGWNFLNNNADLIDERGHGTFVAGIIAAKKGNGIGIAGINPGAVIMPLKVADKDGNTNSLQIFRAIKYAADHGARIINVSLGARGVSRLEQLAINHATAKGALVVVASGNEGNYLGEYGPASARGVLAVGAVDFDMERSTVSSKGPNNGLVAPGEEIYSLHSQDAGWMGPSGDKERLYDKASGTSFSTPMVAATASLLLVKNPSLTNKQLEDILVSSADDMDDEGWDDGTGAGLLNAYTALNMAPEDIFNVKITDVTFVGDKKKKKIEWVDVYATVRGDIDQYIVEVGKGKYANKFKQVAGPLKDQASSQWVARILKDDLTGSSDWIIKVTATNKKGTTKSAQTLIEFK